VDDAPHAVGALRQVGATLIEIAQTRLELGAVELAEERERLLQQALAGLSAVIGVGIGLLFAVLALAWWVGPPNGAFVLAAAALAAWAAAALAIRHWRVIARGRPPLLHDTLDQLRCDARELAGGGGS
jgi:uncharacterized membrane protein YqjE